MIEIPQIKEPADKPRVVFMFVNAGMGHIMPMHALADAFEEKYGQYCTVVRSFFFSETNARPLLKLEQKFVREVRRYNHSWLYGYLNMYLMELLGTKLLSWMIMEGYVPGARRAAMAHMKELQADMVVNTHWSTGYYAERLKQQKPLTVTYIPDVQTVALFRYPSDMTLLSSERGYLRACRRHKNRYREENLRLVDFAIRREAFAISRNKQANRRELGLDAQKMTLVLFEGGYGLGKMGKIVQLLLERDLPLNIIAICGKNQKLHARLTALRPGRNIKLRVEGFCTSTLQYLAAADVFLGKSGASSVAEATFFGLAVIITKYATDMERNNGEYYLKDVKNARKIFQPAKVVEQIETWLQNPEELEQLQKNALAYHDRYGSEKSADVFWEMLCKQNPSLGNRERELQAVR